MLTSAHASAATAWLDEYRASAPTGDVLTRSIIPAGWETLVHELAAASDNDLARASSRVRRHADDISTGFRSPGDVESRKWPLSPLPLILGQREWSGIGDAVIQRAHLMESLLADIYGSQRLVGNDLLPAALLNGSPHFLRPMVGLTPPGGWHLHFYALDLGLDPLGGWRVLADHTRTPTGAGYALENRMALTRMLPGLTEKLNIERLAPFFANVRAGIAASCERIEPRIGLLTPGRFNPSYAEQAHLARYLGLLLVEGEDLAVHGDRVYIRTIEGMKRIDALWRRITPRLLDPLAFDSDSRIGVPGLIDAMAAGNVVVANAPGAGVLEAPAFMAFVPDLSIRLTGEPLRIPNLATWWCGQDRERDMIVGQLEKRVIGPAFITYPRALPAGPSFGGSLSDDQREALMIDLMRRGIDYVGQEAAQLSTMPSIEGHAIMPRPFMLRVFAARDANGSWSVMPGGFVRLGTYGEPHVACFGEGSGSADLSVVSTLSVMPVTLVASPSAQSIRRNPGTLPSRVADNLFWLGRYLERAGQTLALVKSASGDPTDADDGSEVGAAAQRRLFAMLFASGAARPTDPDILEAALADLHRESVVRSLVRARDIAEGCRERLSHDVWQLLDGALPTGLGLTRRAQRLSERLAALAGLTAENMGRTAGWRFLDAGRRVERGITTCRLAQALAGDDATADDLDLLLELTDARIGYRQRYSTGVALAAVRDLVMLDPTNPRSAAYQVDTLVAHFNALPRLSDDGIPEAHQAEAAGIAARFLTLSAAALDSTAVAAIEARLLALGELIARRYFLRGGEALRSAGLTVA